MSQLFLSRGSLLALVTGVHLALLWAVQTAFNDQPVEPPVPHPMVMAEMLPSQPQPKAQPVQPPAPPVKREVVKPAKPEPRPKVKPAPAPTPTPDPAPSERAITAPPPAAPPAPSAPAEAAPPAAAVQPAPGPVSAPRFDAAYLNNPPPAYPPLARRMGEEGRVVLRVHVTPEGAAGEVRLHTSSGSSLLDDAAIAAVGRWRFVPARQGSGAVAAWVQVPVAFKLN